MEVFVIFRRGGERWEGFSVRSGRRARPHINRLPTHGLVGRRPPWSDYFENIKEKGGGPHWIANDLFLSSPDWAFLLPSSPQIGFFSSSSVSGRTRVGSQIEVSFLAHAWQNSEKKLSSKMCKILLSIIIFFSAFCLISHARPFLSWFPQIDRCVRTWYSRGERGGRGGREEGAGFNMPHNLSLVGPPSPLSSPPRPPPPSSFSPRERAGLVIRIGNP